jgi:hypothetical protein
VELRQQHDRDLIFVDSETCGLHSMMVLLQYAVNDGDIELWEIWREPVQETLEVIEWMMEHNYVGFNNTFDIFHICKIYTIWRLLPNNWIPEEHIEEIALKEPLGQDGPCVKPYGAMDLLLHSRKGPYQSLMARKPIRVRKVPLTPVEWDGQMIPMAYALANYLETAVELDGLNFARTSNPDAPRWTVVDRKDADGLPDRELADVMLKFHPNGSLKSLAEHALKMKPKYLHGDISINHEYPCFELGYAPYALAVSTPEKNWEVRVPSDNKQGYVIQYAWPGVIEKHIDHWATNEAAREYAHDDITYTRELYKHFGEPEMNDVDSILSCMVPAIRWHGFTIDPEGIEDVKAKAEEVVVKSPINTNKPSAVREYITAACDETEMLHLAETTGKAKLIEMTTGVEWRITEPLLCLKCMGAGYLDSGECLRCAGTGELKQGLHPAAVRAKEVLDIKIAAKEVELYEKLLTAGKFHASFKVIGTLSSRMAGGDGLNAQGIKHDIYVREKFRLAWEGMTLCGGDFALFEVTIADAVYKDPDLREALVSGQKLHGLFGTCVYPKYTYEQILHSEKHGEEYLEGNMYNPAKSAVFAMFYGGNAFTLVDRLGVEHEVAVQAFERWLDMFPGIRKTQERINTTHQPLVQEGGLGTAIEWREPQEYVESFLGFRRYFTLEYKIIRALFELARKPPQSWRACKVPVLRSQHRGVQTAGGAVASALYGAAGQVADAIVRAATNHEIQSPGAEITKAVQSTIWSIQPYGVNDWRVAPMNVHDEIMSVTHPDYVEEQERLVKAKVEEYREYIPLIKIEWNNDIPSWAQKAGVEESEILDEEEVEEIIFGES